MTYIILLTDFLKGGRFFYACYLGIFEGVNRFLILFFLFGAFCVVTFQFSPVLEVCFKNFVICILGNLLVLYLNGLNTK